MIKALKKLSELLSIKEAANLLGVSTMTLRRWDTRGILRPFRPTLDNRRRYWMDDVLNFLNLKIKRKGVL